MERQVLDFLTKLATEPEALGGFLRDAESVMKQQGLDDRARAALASGDALQVHRAINAVAAAGEASLEQSMAKARQVVEILSSDPTVASWIQNHYCQMLMMWLASRGGPATPPALATADDQAAIRPRTD